MPFTRSAFFAAVHAMLAAVDPPAQPATRLAMARMACVMLAMRAYHARCCSVVGKPDQPASLCHN